MDQSHYMDSVISDKDRIKYFFKFFLSLIYKNAILNVTISWKAVLSLTEKVTSVII